MAGTTLAARAVAAFTTGTSTTFATGSTRTGLGLLVAFRLRQQGTTRQFQLAGLLLNADEFHLHDVTHLEVVLEVVHTLPVVLGNVHQTVLARKDFDEG